MLRLKTRWGIYILSNAVKIDVYTSKGEEIWNVFFSIDSYKHRLFSFETESDAFFFCSRMRATIEEMFIHPIDYLDPWDLDSEIKTALYETDQQGL